MKIRLVILLSALLAGDLPTIQAQDTTAFVYQGRLTDSGSLASGNYRLSFTLFATPNFGSPVSGLITNQVVVADGLFATSLDFGASVFDGTPRWLEITVLGNQTQSAVVLAPRQQISPSPYALFAARAGTVTNGAVTSAQLANNAVAAVHLQNGAVTGDKISMGQVLKSLNGLQDHVSIVAGSGLGLTTNGSVLQINSLPLPDTAWSRTGNAGITPGVNFLGTTDNQQLEVRVNGQRALRLEPTISSPNVIGGFGGNFVSNGVVGAAIGGGGSPSTGGTNLVMADFGVIGGGRNNTVSGVSATVGGGQVNSALGDYATVGGGRVNVASNLYATVSGGRFNTASFDYATIGGGLRNGASGPLATVGGGQNNNSSGAYSSISGGLFNVVTGAGSAIAGGGTNLAAADFSAIGGGERNTIETSAEGAVIGGGSDNSASAPGATVGGGCTNLAGGFRSTIAGGANNKATASETTVGGGSQNRASGGSAAVAGGEQNDASGILSTIGGGANNRATGYATTIAGGIQNRASYDYSTVAGGSQNTANGPDTTVSGGGGNTASAAATTVAGGQGNEAIGSWASVPGGYNNVAAGYFSLAAGRNAKALHDGSFVWSTRADAAPSFADNRFQIHADDGFGVDYDAQRADGGGARWVYIGRAAAGNTITTWNGAKLTDGGIWSNSSDLHRKTDVEAVRSRDILERLVKLSITRWRYTNDSARVRHLGPMAQDFHAAFALGDDEKSIGTVDADGVALAAIQGLNQKFEDEMQSLREALKARDSEIQALKEAVGQLKELISSQAKSNP